MTCCCRRDEPDGSRSITLVDAIGLGTIATDDEVVEDGVFRDGFESLQAGSAANISTSHGLQAARKAYSPFGLLLLVTFCGNLAIYLSVWATPPVLLVYAVIGFGVYREDRRFARDEEAPGHEEDAAGRKESSLTPHFAPGKLPLEMG